MNKEKKKIIIIAGEPNSVNSEIIFKSWKKTSKFIKTRIYIIGNYELIKMQFQKLKYFIELKKVRSLEEESKTNELKIFDIDLKFKDPFKIDQKIVSKYVIKCLNLGHKLSLRNNSAGFINCAVNKGIFLKQNMGVTEFLANKCNVKDNSEVMMIKSKVFAVCPITTHLDLKDVSKKIKYKTIITKIKTIQKSFYKLFKKKPKIGVLGLNPHNAELRNRSEEIKEIIPAISYLKNIGYNINGPLVADTVFIKNYKNYDIIVGMYHDQILAPFKAIFKFDAINLTLGLNYLRVSPDHGVAIDKVKKNKANPSSLIECIKFINNFGK
tara:strand:+ start:977 stop:1951 length:975 start_codon:yes stop_codon:yes gene_type:complete